MHLLHLVLVVEAFVVHSCSAPALASSISRSSMSPSIKVAFGERDAGRPAALAATAQLLTLLFREPHCDAERGRGAQGPLAATERHVSWHQFMWDDVNLPFGRVPYRE